eukprot:scaffold2090_cov225-Prasinococcus_capsulatus_cf.AAC.25
MLASPLLHGRPGFSVTGTGWDADSPHRTAPTSDDAGTSNFGKHSQNDRLELWNLRPLFQQYCFDADRLQAIGGYTSERRVHFGAQRMKLLQAEAGLLGTMGVDGLRDVRNLSVMAHDALTTRYAARQASHWVTCHYVRCAAAAEAQRLGGGSPGKALALR